MASVQELIALAEHENRANNPGASALQSLISGVQNAQKNSLDRAIKLIQMDELRREAAEKEAAAKQLDEYDKRRNSIISSSLEAIGSGKPSVTPMDKANDIYEETVEYGPSGRKLIRKIREPKAASPITSYEQALAEKYRNGEISIEQFQKMKADANPAPVQFVGMQNGQPVLLNPKTKEITTGKLPGEGPLVSTTQTEGQANAVLYGNRAAEADTQILNLGKTIDLSSIAVGAQSKLPNIAKSSPVQQYEQSKRNFLNAILRRESGAVISPSEFQEGDKQYFPQAGDSDEVVAQKAINRQTAIAGLKNASGLPQSKKTDTPTNNNDDLSKMSDDELRAIIKGEK